MIILTDLQKFIEELHLISVKPFGVPSIYDVTDELLPLDEVGGSLLELHILCHFPLNLVQHHFNRGLEQLSDGELAK